MSGVAADRRWPLVFAAAGVLVLLAGVGWLALGWAREGSPEIPDQQASVLGVILAAAGAGVALLAWAWRRRRQASLPATAEQVELAAATLAELVFEQWLAEAQARALGDPEPMPVRWRLTTPDLMDHPDVIAPGGPLSFTGSSDRIGPLTASFRALPRRRLVITGGPGTGKTTLAVQLLLELLAHPEPGDPVPVLFSLVSWDPEAQPRMQDWLAAQLARTYPALRAIAPDTPAALAERGRILPILDGLDEVTPVRRAGLIAALNTSLAPDGGLALTSRRAEYRAALADAGDVLTAAAVISPLALTATDAATFLRKHLPHARHPDWDGVLAALTGGSAPHLAAVTANPLGLWLVRTVYLDAHRPPGPLTDTARYPTAAALQAHLLEALIPAVVHSRPPLPRRRRDAPDAPLRPTRQHRPEDLRRWLTTIAEHLRAAGTRDWLWWELAQQTAPTLRDRNALRKVAGLTAGLAVAVTVGLMTGLTAGGMPAGLPAGRPAELPPGLPTGLPFGLLFGLMFGLIFGLMFWLLFGKSAPPRHANLRLSGRIPELLRKLALGLTRGLALGLPLGLLGGLAFGLAFGLTEGLTYGRFILVLALAIGLTFALTDFLGTSDIAERSASPGLSYRGDRARSVIELLVSGLALGLLSELMTWMVFGLTAGFPPELLLGLAFGLVIGLAFGPARSAWFAFVVAALRQTVRRPQRLPAPWRVMTILDDAYRLGLLRTVGPAYQFRHAELQDHLAPNR